MLFGLLKRKFFAIEERDEDDTASTPSDTCSPRKRLRVREPASINDATSSHSQAAHTAGTNKGSQVIDGTREGQEKETAEGLGKLRARLKECEETSARVKKETEPEVTTINKLKEETMVCMVCQDLVQNPQFLQCGHSACYSCLRSWWTQPLPDNYNPEMIDTVAESDLEDEADETNAAGPRVLRRHNFRSVVHCEKFCPYCNAQVTSRPVPELRTRKVVETLNSDLHPVPPHIQARRQARLTRRQDIWRGIFKPENQVVVIPTAEPAGPPPPHPDPILNHFAQAQYRRAQEGAVAVHTRRREKAFEDGRHLEYVRTMHRLEREEQAQRDAIAWPRVR